MGEPAAARIGSPTWTGRDFLALGLSILAVMVVGFTGSLATGDSVEDWYPTLEKPSWNPPNTVFPIVWTALYLTMGFAAFRVWHKAGWPASRDALAIYGVQLMANLSWSILFFGLRRIGLAFAEILVLLTLIIATIVLFWRHDRLAGALMIPYALWVAFAAVLNLTILTLN